MVYIRLSTHKEVLISTEVSTLHGGAADKNLAKKSQNGEDLAAERNLVAIVFDAKEKKNVPEKTIHRRGFALV